MVTHLPHGQLKRLPEATAAVVGEHCLLVVDPAAVGVVAVDQMGQATLV